MRKMISVVLAILPGCMMEVHEGNGVSATDVRDVGAFDAVVNTTELDVAITDGPTSAAAVICDENLLEDVVLEVNDGELSVEIGEKEDRWIQLAPETDCGVELVVPSLTALTATGSGGVRVESEVGFALADIELTGSGDVEVDAPLWPEHLEASATGSGDLHLSQVEAVEAGFSLTGSGDLKVDQGAIDRLDVSATGSGDSKLEGLESRSAHVSLTGSGDAEVRATEAIEASLTGSGDLTVWGAPAERDVASTGSGDVNYAE